MKYLIYLLIICSTKQDLPIKKICKSESVFSEANPDLLDNLPFSDFFISKEILKKDENYLIIEMIIKKKDYIVKRVKIDIEEIDERLKREINLLDQVKGSPHLIEFYDCIYNPEKNFLYIIKEKLFSSLKKKTLKNKNPKQRLEFFINIGKGLLELHELGYIHNDLKPENIMVKSSSFEFPKIINFFLAGKIDEMSQGGTLLYVSYEKLVNPMVVSDPSIDVLAFALTIASLELGEIELIKQVRKNWGLTKSNNWTDYHNRLAKKLFKKYYIVLEDPNFLVRGYRFIKSYFMDNRKERIYNFEDLMDNMMSNNFEERLALIDCIEFLEKFKILHENCKKIQEDVITNNGELNIEKKSYIMMTKSISDGEALENIKESVNFIEESHIERIIL